MFFNNVSLHLLFVTKYNMTIDTMNIGKRTNKKTMCYPKICNLAIVHIQAMLIRKNHCQ